MNTNLTLLFGLSSWRIVQLCEPGHMNNVMHCSPQNPKTMVLKAVVLWRHALV